MVRKKRKASSRSRNVKTRGSRTKSAKIIRKPSSLGKKLSVAWKNLTLFVVLFILSFVLYSVSSNSLFVNFFGIISIIFGFLTFAFLIALIVLAILKTGRK